MRPGAKRSQEVVAKDIDPVQVCTRPDPIEVLRDSDHVEEAWPGLAVRDVPYLELVCKGHEEPLHARNTLTLCQ